MKSPELESSTPFLNRDALSSILKRDRWCDTIKIITNLRLLQDVMGYRNICTTMETYTKALREKKLETIQALNEAFKIS